MFRPSRRGRMTESTRGSEATMSLKRDIPSVCLAVPQDIVRQDETAWAYHAEDKFIIFAVLPLVGIDVHHVIKVAGSVHIPAQTLEGLHGIPDMEGYLP